MATPSRAKRPVVGWSSAWYTSSSVITTSGTNTDSAISTASLWKSIG